MSDMRLKVVLTGDGRQLTGSLKTAQSEVQQFGQTSVQAGAASTQAFSKTRSGVESISTQLQAARQQLLTFIGVHQALNAGRQMVQTVAAYQDAQTQLKGLTATAADYAEQEQYLIDLSGSHHKNLLTLTSSYSRLLTLQNAGLMTQAEGRDILEGLSNAASQLGASNAQLEQSMYGLAQGLSSGILRAEELNQVTEPLPGLLQELDKAAGMSAGGFRELVNAGEVTSALFRDTLITALAAYDGAAERAANNLSAKFTDVQNSYLGLARELQQPLSDGLGPLLDGISASLAWTAENAETLGAVLQGAIVVGAGRATVAIVSMTAAKLADIRANREAAAAELKLAQAQAAQTATALRSAKAQAIMGGGRALVVRATDAHTAALARLTAAQAANAATASRLAGVGRGMLGLLGGPVGLAVTVGLTAASFVAFGNSAKEAVDGTEWLTKSINGLTAAQARQQIQQGEEPFKQAELDARKYAAQIETLTGNLSRFPNSSKADEWAQALIDAEGNFDTASQTIAAYNKKLAELEALVDSINNGSNTVEPPSADPSLAANIDKTITALAEQYVELEMGARGWLAYQMAQQGASAEQIKQALDIFDATADLKAQRAAEAEAIKQAEAAQSSYASTLSKSASSSIKSLSDVEKQSQRVWSALAAGKISSAQAAAAIDGLASAGASLAGEQQQWIDQMVAAMDPTRALQEEITVLQEAFEDGLFGDLSEDKFNDYIDGLKKKLAELNGVKIQDPAVQMGNAMQTVAGGIKDVAGAMGGLYEEGSRGAQNMAVAMQAANLIAAIGAVLTQGMGDPYTAFARMAAMAVAVAGLGYSVGSIGGDAPDDAAIRQASQGTGTVLGDTSAKSESIANAVEVTADATSELVGINRGMLRALESMQAGISGASVMIAQQMGRTSFDYGDGRTAIATPKSSGFDKAADFTNSSFMSSSILTFATGGLNKIMGGFFKGAAKMLGGKSKVTDEGVQIVGATLAEMIEETTVKGYQTTRTRKSFAHSWKTHEATADLSDDVALQFNRVFASLADSVYQGATALGFAGDDVSDTINNFVIETQKISLKGLNAEEQQAEIEAVFSVMFDNLAESTVEFLPKFQQAGEALGETLARVATNVQVTEEAVFRLGFAAENINPEQFASLSVYLIDAAGGLEQFIGAMSGFVDKFAPESHKLELLTADMSRALSEVGLAVPATRDEMWQLMQTMDATTEAGADQIATLLRVGDTADAYYKMLEQAGMRIQALLGADQSDALTGYLGQLADWSASELSRIEQDYRERIALAEQQLRIGRELRQYVEQLRISELSPYDPGEKLELATEQFAALLVKAEAGDMEAAGQLQSAANAYLQNADAYYGRSDPYLTIFEEVTRSLDRLGLDIMGGLDDNSIERLNQQMLAEQQRIRDYTQQELQWAVRQYDALTSIEQLLELLPGSLADQLQDIIDEPSSEAAVTPDRDGLLLAQIEQMYTHYFGRDVDVEGAQYWVNIARDEGLDAVDWNIRNSEEYKKIHGSHKTGLQRVPFDGYVAELHKDERVLTEKEAAEYNSFDSGAIVSELAALRQEVAHLRAERAQDASKAEQQRNSQTDATETLVRVNRTPVKMT